MEILFVATELSPMAKVGGLADVVFALSKTLRNQGHRVTLALPRYPAFEEAGVLLARRLTPLKLPALAAADLPAEAAGLADRPTEVILFDARLGSGVDVVFFDVQVPASDVFPGGSLFGDVTSKATDKIYSGEGTLVGALKVSLFNRAVVEFLKARVATGGLRAGEAPFDAVHVHDWPAAMIPFLMREVPELAGLASVLTIHDASAQGFFAADKVRAVLRLFGLSMAHFTLEGLEFYGGVNLLKGGIVSADVVTTVSPSYARELTTEGRGFRLEGVLRARPTPVQGIVNGVDASVWNPATDPSIVARYDSDDWSNRGRSKSTLLAELGLPLDPAIPLFVSLGRVTKQKGTDVLAKSIARLMKQDLCLVVAGRGDPAIEAELKAAASEFGERVRYLGFVEEKVAHRLVAAADFVLMPSRSEPCGLVQLYGQRYGAIPVVARTGGLVDTVVDVDVELETGTGLLFEGATVEELAGAVGRAVSVFRHPRLSSLRRRVMRLDVGWERPARLYAQIYARMVEARAAHAAGPKPE